MDVQHYDILCVVFTYAFLSRSVDLVLDWDNVWKGLDQTILRYHQVYLIFDLHPMLINPSDMRFLKNMRVGFVWLENSKLLGC